MASWIEFLDAQLDELFRGWNTLTSVIALLLLLYVVYPIVTARDPDTHPFLLSRQANASAVRKPGESAVYRSVEVPQGYPLKSGLNVKDPGAGKWASGRDGDVRDIWRQAVKGQRNDNGDRVGAEATIVTLRGADKPIETDLSTVSRHINIIGSYIKAKGATCVGIYLPNSVELLAAVFAAAFYGFHPVLIPYDKPNDVVLKLINLSKADFLIAAAGTLPAQDVRSKCQSIREVTWVVEETSREVDWTDASESTSTWHEIVEEQASQATAELPPNSKGDKLADFITLWLDESPTSGELVAFTHGNIVAAVGAQVSALPTKHRMSSSDIFLPAESLSAPYMLIQTLAALFSNSSVALNSVSGVDVPITSVARNIAPTIVAATSMQAFNLHDTTKQSVNTAGKKMALKSQTASLKTGIMPTPTLATRISSPVTANIGTKPGSVRLIYVFDRTNSDSPPCSSARLSELRAFTGARVIHALTTAKVSGPVAQTGIYDYRHDADETLPAHFGVPPSCLELMLKDKDAYTTTDESVRGELIARGPAVANGEANLGVYAEFRDDGCLKYLFEYPESSTKPSNAI